MSATSNPQEWWSARQVARILGITKREVLYLCSRGVLAADRWPGDAEAGWMYGITKESVRKYIAEQLAEGRRKRGRPSKVSVRGPAVAGL